MVALRLFPILFLTLAVGGSIFNHIYNLLANLEVPLQSYHNDTIYLVLLNIAIQITLLASSIAILWKRKKASKPADTSANKPTTCSALVKREPSKTSRVARGFYNLMEYINE